MTEKLDCTIDIRYRGKTVQIPRTKIKEFADYLSTMPAYSAANVDTHIGFLYSGNLIAVQEFMEWYELSQ